VNLKGGAAHKVIGKLLTEGLVEEIPARGALSENAALRLVQEKVQDRPAWPPARFLLPLLPPARL